MKKACEKCGKELGLLERSYKINDSRLDMKYNTLCGQCGEIIQDSINTIKRISNLLDSTRQEHGETFANDAAHIDSLTALAVYGIFKYAPDFSQEETELHQTLFAEEEATADMEKNLRRFIYKVLHYNALTMLTTVYPTEEAFMENLQQNTIFLEHAAMVWKDNRERATVAAFFSKGGFVFFNSETEEVLHAGIPKDIRVEYAIKAKGEGETEKAETQIVFSNLKIPTGGPNPVVLFLSNETTVNKISVLVQSYNEKIVIQEQRHFRDEMETLKEKMERDLKKVKPDEPLHKISLDCVLLFLAKNYRSMNKSPKGFIENEGNIGIALLRESYRDNLKAARLNSEKAIVDALKNNTVYLDEIEVKYGSEHPEPGWGFFTRHGYIIGFGESRRLMFIYDDSYPNNVYFPFDTGTYKDVPYLHIPLEEKRIKRKGDYRSDDGLTLYEMEADSIAKLSAFLDRNNLFYQMAKYISIEERLENDKEAQTELKRISDLLYRDLGYMPFALYSEWFGIEQGLKKSDPLLDRMIPERMPRYNEAQYPHFTEQILTVFDQGAEALQKDLDLPTISIAKALLWTYFKEHVMSIISAEWMRIAGEIIHTSDNLYTAMLKYIRSETINVTSKYYLGLFIYHLMARGILKEDSFLDAYDRAIDAYFECKKQLGLEMNEDKPRYIYEEIQQEEQRRQDPEPKGEDKED